VRQVLATLYIRRLSVSAVCLILFWSEQSPEGLVASDGFGHVAACPLEKQISKRSKPMAYPGQKCTRATFVG